MEGWWRRNGSIREDVGGVNEVLEGSLEAVHDETTMPLSMRPGIYTITQLVSTTLSDDA